MMEKNENSRHLGLCTNRIGRSLITKISQYNNNNINNGLLGPSSICQISLMAGRRFISYLNK